MPRGITSGIIYIPLDVRWPRSKKVRAMIVEHGERGFAAWGLYLAMACYCRENLSDGFVPAAEIGALAYPLPADAAAGLVALLADSRLIADSGSDGTSHSTSDSGSHSGSDGTRHSTGYLVRAYVKRNGTRAETLAETAAKSAAGRSGAKTRWSDDRIAGAIAPAMAQAVPDIDIDRDKRRARAPGRGGAPARDDDGWSPSGVLDQTPTRSHRSTAERAPSSRSVAAAMAHTHRPGGPATEEQRAARAEEARKGLANRPARLGDPEPEPAADRLHGEALARAQLAEVAAARRIEQAVANAAAADDDQADPLGLGGGREVESEDGEWHIEPADPEDRPGEGEADNPRRADPSEPGPEDFGELTEPADDEYPF
jgi:hypothetical protein